MRTRPLFGFAAALTVSVLALTGCAGGDATPAAGSAASAADAVSVADAWVKAADAGMTGGFGLVTNEGDETVTLVAAETDAAGSVELHETAGDGQGGMSMKEIEGGFEIPAGGTLALEPGGHHLMFMGLTAPLLPGEDVTITLTFDDGSTTEVTAPVKAYSGANEEYEEGHGGSDHGDSGHNG